MTRTAVFLLACLLSLAVRAADIQVLALFRDKAVIDVDGHRYTLSAGQSTPGGVRLVSADSEKARLEVDGKVAVYRLGDRISTRFRPATGNQVVIAPDSQGMYHVDGSINGFQVRFVVDTGSTLIAMNRHQAQRIGLDYRMDGKPAVSSTASGLDKVWLVTLHKVTVGDIVLRDVRAQVHNGDYPQEILLGNSFLNGVDLSRRGRLLQLQTK